MRRKQSTPSELEATRDARLAQRRLERQERYLTLLRLAMRTREDNGASTQKINEAVTQAANELEGYQNRAGGRIKPRRRVSIPDGTERPLYNVYIDECGSHNLKSKEDFQVFVLGGVVILADDEAKLDRKWRRWKREKLGSAQKLVHTEDIKKGKMSFSCGGSTMKRKKAVASLSRFLAAASFSAIACVLRRPQYYREFGRGPLDDSLPSFPYLMAVHFLAERIVLAMHLEFGNGIARLTVESRGSADDARFQYEFARLFLDGTSYISASMFRKFLEPGIEFLDKKANSTGLQLADLLVRPCGEKVMNPGQTPKRWPEIREKLCVTRETAHSILGLKIVPWDEAYAGVWES